MSDLLECRKVLQQDGKRLFCDECGFESFIPDRPPKKERKPTMSEELATLKAENDRLKESLRTVLDAVIEFIETPEFRAVRDQINPTAIETILDVREALEAK